MEKKICARCKKEKLYSDFYKNKRAKDGLYHVCKECHIQYRSRDTYRKYERNYAKQFRKDNPQYYKQWRREYYKNNPSFRINNSMSSLIWRAIKGKKNGRMWQHLVGYTLKDLMKYLENKFESWMNWENYGKWEIDHIKPKSLFKYETAEDSEFKKCWALENLQPLEKSANRRKNNHYKLK